MCSIIVSGATTLFWSFSMLSPTTSRSVREASNVRQAAKKFGVPRTTVQSMLKSLEKVTKDGVEVKLLPKTKRGRTTMLPSDLDDKVIKMAKSLRLIGVSINYNILVGIARGIVIANGRSLLRENGGTVELQETWAQSICRRMNLVRRRVTTCKQPVSPGYIKEVGFTFRRQVATIVQQYNISDELIFNLDQTPLPFFLVSKYTLEEKGTLRVPIANSSDYRQITGTFVVTAAGEFLPMQLIYQGKTNRCHPKYDFPDDFEVTHTANHWSNEEKAISLIENIILPHAKLTKERLELPEDQKWLVIKDVFKGQWTEDVKAVVSDNNGMMTPVPNNMTNHFQPLDLSTNRSCKAFLKREAQQWYASQVSQQLDDDVDQDQIKVNLKISNLKPLHAKWITKFYDYIRCNPAIVMSGWEQAGITAVLREEIVTDDPFK